MTTNLQDRDREIIRQLRALNFSILNDDYIPKRQYHANFGTITFRCAKHKRGAPVSKIYFEVGALRGYRGRYSTFWQTEVNLSEVTAVNTGDVCPVLREAMAMATEKAQVYQQEAKRREALRSELESEKAEFAKTVTDLTGYDCTTENLLMNGSTVAGITFRLTITGTAEEVARKLKLVLAVV